MKVGSQALITCPSDMAFGEDGLDGLVPPNTTVLFEIEILESRP